VSVGTLTDSYMCVNFVAYSGVLATSDPKDQKSYGADDTPGSITPTVSGELLVSVYAMGQTPEAKQTSIDNDLTIRVINVYGGGSMQGSTIADRVYNSISPISVTWDGTAEANTRSLIVSFKSTGSGQRSTAPLPLFYR